MEMRDSEKLGLALYVFFGVLATTVSGLWLAFIGPQNGRFLIPMAMFGAAVASVALFLSGRAILRLLATTPRPAQQPPQPNPNREQDSGVRVDHRRF